MIKLKFEHLKTEEELFSYALEELKSYEFHYVFYMLKLFL
jgi:hypothetical protein